MTVWLMVALGGGAGALARYGTVRVMNAWLGGDFPWGTMAVNFAGSLAMGALSALFAAALPNHGLIRALLATGFLGGYTTFSAFSLDLVALTDRGEWGAGLLYGGGSLALGVGGLILGRMMVRMMVGA